MKGRGQVSLLSIAQRQRIFNFGKGKGEAG